MGVLTYQCAECNQTMIQCQRCGLIYHVCCATHICEAKNAGKMRVCPFATVQVDVPEVGDG